MITAVILAPGKDPRWITQADNYRGYLVQRTGVGGKGLIKPMFNGKSLEEAGLKQEAIRYLETHSQNEESILDIEKFAAHAMRWDTNTHGYEVLTEAQYKARKDDANLAKFQAGEMAVTFFDSVTGLRIEERLPAQMWSIVKPYATYNKGDEDDMEFYDDQYPGITSQEVKGWSYSDQAMAALIRAGYRVTFADREMATGDEAEIGAARQARRQEEEEYRRQVAEVREGSHAWYRRFQELRTQEGYCSEAEAEAAAKLPRIMLGVYQGATIYGTGEWFHVQEDDLYIVQNNGMDGDNWSRNNYPTGGAGAICWKVEGGAVVLHEYRAWLESLGHMQVHAERL